ncbi:hypothetical protein [Desulforhopalus sp. IMCC35007]|uniref:hypothetical protein n=1 Tax=Desulforhopalus sp. IMCC35007 TaxID=2569543 RepID=UPI00145DC111|nr:hypothetical protein [Desulforhopalus sp. IMCC35007]
MAPNITQARGAFIGMGHIKPDEGTCKYCPDNLSHHQPSSRKSVLKKDSCLPPYRF